MRRKDKKKAMLKGRQMKYEKNLHGAFERKIKEIQDNLESWTWLRKGYLKKELSPAESKTAPERFLRNQQEILLSEDLRSIGLSFTIKEAYSRGHECYFARIFYSH